MLIRLSNSLAKISSRTLALALDSFSLSDKGGEGNLVIRLAKIRSPIICEVSTNSSISGEEVRSYALKLGLSGEGVGVVMVVGLEVEARSASSVSTIFRSCATS